MLGFVRYNRLPDILHIIQKLAPGKRPPSETATQLTILETKMAMITRYRHRDNELHPVRPLPAGGRCKSVNMHADNNNEKAIG